MLVGPNCCLFIFFIFEPNDLIDGYILCLKRKSSDHLIQDKFRPFYFNIHENVYVYFFDQQRLTPY